MIYVNIAVSTFNSLEAFINLLATIIVTQNIIPQIV